MTDDRGVFGGHSRWTRRMRFLDDSACRLGWGDGAYGVSMKPWRAHNERYSVLL